MKRRHSDTNIFSKTSPVADAPGQVTLSLAICARWSIAQRKNPL
jgi:hypothetical protein